MNRTTDGLNKLGLQQCTVHGQLFSNKPGGFCKKCGPNTNVIAATVACKRGHIREATQKRCKECDKITRAARKAAK